VAAAGVARQQFGRVCTLLARSHGGADATGRVPIPLVVDAAGLAAMIGKSHRTVMVLCAREAWRSGGLPAPTYIGASVRTRCGKGRRWLISTVDAWLVATRLAVAVAS